MSLWEEEPDPQVSIRNELRVLSKNHGWLTCKWRWRFHSLISVLSSTKRKGQRYEGEWPTVTKLQLQKAIRSSAGRTMIIWISWWEFYVCLLPSHQGIIIIKKRPYERPVTQLFYSTCGPFPSFTCCPPMRPEDNRLTSLKKTKSQSGSRHLDRVVTGKQTSLLKAMRWA